MRRVPLMAMLLACSLAIHDVEQMEHELHHVAKSDVLNFFDKEQTLAVRLGRCLQKLEAATQGNAQPRAEEFRRLVSPQVRWTDPCGTVIFVLSRVFQGPAGNSKLEASHSANSVGLAAWEHYAKHNALPETDKQDDLEKRVAEKLGETLGRAAKRHSELHRALGVMLDFEVTHDEREMRFIQQVMGLPNQDPMLTLGTSLGESLTDDHIDEIMKRVHLVASRYTRAMRFFEHFQPRGSVAEMKKLEAPVGALHTAMLAITPAAWTLEPGTKKLGESWGSSSKASGKSDKDTPREGTRRRRFSALRKGVSYSDGAKETAKISSSKLLSMVTHVWLPLEIHSIRRSVMCNCVACR